MLSRLPNAALQDYDYYMDTHRLRISTSNMKNANTRARLEEIKTTVLQNLSQLPAAPGAQMAVPPPRVKQVQDERLSSGCMLFGSGATMTCWHEQTACCTSCSKWHVTAACAGHVIG